jgi:hypothetical protein
LAAVAAALNICCQNAAAQDAAPAQKPPAPKPARQAAQPAGTAQTQAKPAAKTPAKPKAQPTPRQTAAQLAPSGKSVCVASALAYRFEVQKIGFMVFGNSLDGVAADTWGIDEAAARKIQEVLGREFAVRRVTVPKAALAELETRRIGFLRNENDDFMRAVAAGAGKCDFSITLTRAATQYGGTNQSVAGLGIVRHDNPLFPRVYVFASYIIRMYDGNLTALRSEKPTMHPLLVTPLTTPGLSAMYREADQSWWPEPAQAAAQSAQLKNATRALVEEGLAKKMPQMFEGS